MIDELPIVLNTVLLLVLLLQVSAATISGFLAERLFGGLGVSVATMVMTVVLFVYAEAIPKTIAVRSPHRMALKMTPMLSVLVKTFGAFVGVLVALADLHLPGEVATFGALSEEEIRALARESASAGQIEDSDAHLVDRSFAFNDRCVGDVMVPRERIESVGAEQTVESALGNAIEHGHRRLPVCGRNLDDIVGFVRMRDLAAAVRQSPYRQAGTLAHPPLRCNASEPIAQLLRRMQSSGRWLALVEDSALHTAGLVTIEDLVAELVGEIADERDIDPSP